MKYLAAAALVVLAFVLAYLLPAPALAPLGVFTPPVVSVLFVGDIMLDRNVARTIAQEGPEVLFAGVRELLASTDARVGNLEGTITTNPSIAQRDSSILKFTFNPAQAQATLGPLHFNALSLANNHTLDFGEFGYDDTRTYLTSPTAGINAQPFGNPYNDQGRLSTELVVKGKKLCLVGYHGLFEENNGSTIFEIERLRPECWRVVVFAHWGVEYEPHQDAAQETMAHSFIDAGADLVVGAHPHVVEPVEVYKSKAIFYSLGNFMFDQNFSWATTHGLAVRAEFSEQRTCFKLTPTTILQQHASISLEPDRQKTLAVAGIADFCLP